MEHPRGEPRGNVGISRRRGRKHQDETTLKVKSKMMEQLTRTIKRVLGKLSRTVTCVACPLEAEPSWKPRKT